MPEEDLVELKFRLYDGSDIGPIRYSSASTVAMIKERIISEWPREWINNFIHHTLRPSNASNFSRRKVGYEDICDKKIIPKVAGDVKLISAGKVLENNKTVGQCRTPFGELPGGVITMHVLVQPSLAKAKTEKVDDSPRKVVCSCSIL